MFGFSLNVLAQKVYLDVSPGFYLNRISLEFFFNDGTINLPSTTQQQ